MCNMFVVEMVNNITFIAQIKQVLDKLISLVKICQYLKNNICIYIYIKYANTKIKLRLVVLFLCFCYVFETSVRFWNFSASVVFFVFVFIIILIEKYIDERKNYFGLVYLNCNSDPCPTVFFPLVCIFSYVENAFFIFSN